LRSKRVITKKKERKKERKKQPTTAIIFPSPFPKKIEKMLKYDRDTSFLGQYYQLCGHKGNQIVLGASIKRGL